MQGGFVKDDQLVQTLYVQSRWGVGDISFGEAYVIVAKLGFTWSYVVLPRTSFVCFISSVASSLKMHSSYGKAKAT